MKIKCINLEKCKDRREFMQKQLPNIEFFDGIDANYIELKHVKDTIYKIFYQGSDTGLLHDKSQYVYNTAIGYGLRHYRRFRDIPYANIEANIYENSVSVTYKGQTFYTDITEYKKETSIGELGCALSHYYLAKQLLNDENHDYYIVLEDDVIINSDLEPVIKHLEYYDLLWDIAFLNIPQHLLANSLISFTSLFNLSIFSGYSGTYSYVLNKKGAQKLIDAYNGYINLPSDDFLSKQVHLTQLRIKKPICFTTDEFNSIINTSFYLNK